MFNPYWEYFLAIESDLCRCSRYVEFHPSNYSTYSVEFARIILSASSEFDTIAKYLCGYIDGRKKPQDVNAYRSIILPRFPNFHATEITIPRHAINLHPWSEWKDEENPAWWKAYNNVKHQRTEFFEQATLLNACNAVAGLLAGLMHVLRMEQGRSVLLDPAPQFMDSATYGTDVYASLNWTFEIPDDAST